MVAITGIFLQDESLMSVFVSTDKLLEEGYVDPANFTLSTGFVTAVVIKLNLIQLLTTNFYGSDTTGLTVSFNGSGVQTPGGSETLAAFSNVAVTNKISARLKEYPELKFPTLNSAPYYYLDVTDNRAEMAGANVLVPNDINAAANNTTRLNALIHANGMNWHGGTDNQFNRRWLYFPNGTYYFNNTIYWCRYVYIVGQTRDGAIWKLVDGAAGFNATGNSRKRFVGMSDTQQDQQGYGFDTFICNLTFDSGNNPEAICVSCYLNNRAGIFNCKMVGNGHVGFGARGGSFPASAMWLYVEGFRYGVASASGSTIYNLYLKNQTVAGFYLGDRIPLTVPEGTNGTQQLCSGSGQGGSTVGAFNFISEQSNANVPAVLYNFTVQNFEFYQGTFINCSFFGNGGPAIVSKLQPSAAAGDNGKHLYVEELRQRGYSSAISDEHNSCVVGRGYVPWYSLEDISLASERPIKGSSKIFPNFPKVWWPDPATSTWRTLDSYGITQTTDVAMAADANLRAAHQAAFESAFSDTAVDVLVIPHKYSAGNKTQYWINDTVQIAGERTDDLFVLGMGLNTINIIYGSMNDGTKSAFEIGDNNGHSIWLIGWEFSPEGDNNELNAILHHKSDSDIIVYMAFARVATVGSNVYADGYLADSEDVGNVFFATVLCRNGEFSKGQYVVATNLNWQDAEWYGSNKQFIRVTEGAKLMTLASRHESGTHYLTDLGPQLVDGTDSFMYQCSTWMDHSFDPNPAERDQFPLTIQNGGKYHGSLTQHGQLSQAYLNQLRVSRGGSTDISVASCPQIPGNPNSRSLLTVPLASYGGTGTKPAPKLVSATIGSTAFGNDKIWLLFDLPLFNSIPSTGAFAVTVAGASRAVNTVAISGTRFGNFHSFVCTLTLASAVTTGQAVVVSYTQPGSNPRLQSKQNALVASFSNVSVANLV